MRNSIGTGIVRMNSIGEVRFELLQWSIGIDYPQAPLFRYFINNSDYRRNKLSLYPVGVRKHRYGSTSRISGCEERLSSVSIRER